MMTSWVTSDLILRLLGAVGVGGGQQGQAGKSFTVYKKAKPVTFLPIIHPAERTAFLKGSNLTTGSNSSQRSIPVSFPWFV